MEIDFTALLVALAMDLATTVLFYLLVPVILVIRGKEMTLEKIKRISILNAGSIAIIFIVIKSALGSSGTSGAVFLWGYVGYAIMKKCLYTRFQKDKSKIPPEDKITNSESDLGSSVGSKTPPHQNNDDSDDVPN